LISIPHERHKVHTGNKIRYSKRSIDWWL